MTISTMDAQFRDHIVARIRMDVEFLASQNELSAADVSAIMDRVSSTANNVQSRQVAPPPRATYAAPTGPPPATQAKALWAYNEYGKESNDLSFSAGDIIEIIDETNEDWWTGCKVNADGSKGKQALFPSSYVEKLSTPVVSAPSARSLPPMLAPQSSSSQKPAYRPFMAAHHGGDAPPPGGVNSVGLQQDAEGQEKKKSKYGKYGNTFAHSAAGGVGLGAGAAIGGGLVRAIF